MPRLGANRCAAVALVWIAPFWGALLCVVAVSGCYEAHVVDADGTIDEHDASIRDGGELDASLDGSPSDAGLVFDAGPPDAGMVLDGGPRDGGIAFDAGPRDGGIVLDGGPRDGGPRDGGISFDAGPRDGGPRDGGIAFDAGPRDAGLRDGGPRDGGPRDAGIDASGPRSVALRFDPNRFLRVPDRPGLSIAADTTFELWIRARGPGIVSRKGSDAGQQHLMVRIEGTGDATELVVGWVTIDLVRHELRVPFAARLGRWTHVAYVLERTAAATLRATLYVDLAVVATADFPDDTGNSFSVEALLFGRFDGDLDEIRLWNVVRSQAALMASAFTRIRGGTAGLAAYWQIEEAGGQIVLDRSLRGNDGILGERTTPDDLDPFWIFDGAIP